MKGILDGLCDWVRGQIGNVGVYAVRGKQKGPWIARDKAQAEFIIGLIAGGARPTPGHDGTIARPEDTPRKAKPAPVRVRNLAMPWEHQDPSCPCESWKLLDHFYTLNPHIRDAWRKGARGSHQSPYDYFMSINLKRMNRGLAGMTWPPPGQHKITWFVGKGDIPAPDLCIFNPLASVRAFQVEGPPETWTLGLDLDLYDPTIRDTKPGFVWVSFRSKFTNTWTVLSAHRPAWFGIQEWYIGAHPADQVRLTWAPNGKEIDPIEFDLNKVVKGPMWAIMRR